MGRLDARSAGVFSFLFLVFGFEKREGVDETDFC